MPSRSKWRVWISRSLILSSDWFWLLFDSVFLSFGGFSAAKRDILGGYSGFHFFFLIGVFVWDAIKEFFFLNSWSCDHA